MIYVHVDEQGELAPNWAVKWVFTALCIWNERTSFNKYYCLQTRVSKTVIMPFVHDFIDTSFEYCTGSGRESPKSARTTCWANSLTPVRLSNGSRSRKFRHAMSLCLYLQRSTRKHTYYRLLITHILSIQPRYIHHACSTRYFTQFIYFLGFHALENCYRRGSHEKHFVWKAGFYHTKNFHVVSSKDVVFLLFVENACIDLPSLLLMNGINAVNANA